MIADAILALIVLAVFADIVRDNWPRGGAGMKRGLLAVLAAALLTGCATPRLVRVPDADPRVQDAMQYARAATGRTERLPARWHTMPGHAQDMEGWWYNLDANGQPDACGKVQDNGTWFKVLIYVDPKTGWQHRDVWRHEAGHTMQTKEEEGHLPRKWERYFERW